MQDGYRILESGKSGKMAKIYQHHKFPPCLRYPKHEGKDEENLTHFFGHYRYHLGFLGGFCVVLIIPTGLSRKEEQQNIAEYISPCTKEKRPSWRAGRYGRK